MDRAELERLDRESLVTRAQAAGIRRARLLTRPELVDELLRLDPVLDEAQLKRSRGFFGRARDLLSRVVERGLHLPDAADRLRVALGNPVPQVPRPEAQAVPTVTLAEIYAAQGHKQRAIETLRRVLVDEPEHGAARALLEKLEAASYVPPPLPLPPEDDARDEIGSNLGSGSSPTAIVDPSDAMHASAGESQSKSESDAGTTSDDEPEPETIRMDLDEAPTIRRDAALLAPRAEREDDDTREPEPVTSVRAATPAAAAAAEPPPARPVSTVSAPVQIGGSPEDECVAIPLPASAYVCWRLSTATLKRLHDEPAFFFVRIVILTPSWDGPRQEIRDIACDPGVGELLVHELPHRAVIRIAIGIRDGEAFVPFAHSPALEKRPDGTSTKLVRWSLDGYRPIRPDDPALPGLTRALKRVGRATANAGITTGTIELG